MKPRVGLFCVLLALGAAGLAGCGHGPDLGGSDADVTGGGGAPGIRSAGGGAVSPANASTGSSAGAGPARVGVPGTTTPH